MTPESYTAPRVLAGIVAFPPAAFALLMLGNQVRTGFDPMGATLGSTAAAIAALCWWFALRGHVVESRARMRMVVFGGLVVGGIGFVAGFFGPIVLTPEANQGPLLGIFVTGPLGFVLGTVIGWLYARFRVSPAPAGVGPHSQV